jgi:hypothetical protein
VTIATRFLTHNMAWRLKEKTRRALGHALKPTYDGRAIKAQAPGSLGFRGKGGSAVVTLFRGQRWSRGQALNPESERRLSGSSWVTKNSTFYVIEKKQETLCRVPVCVEILPAYWSFLHSGRYSAVICTNESQYWSILTEVLMAGSSVEPLNPAE